MMEALSPPLWVDRVPDLERAMEQLRAAPAIGVDTEANSFFAYQEKVCLIQVSTEDQDYLIDPLAGLDLSGFGEILKDPSKVKIFHDGEYDIGILKNDFNFEFANIFDTRVAVMALGSKTPGLANVLKERFGVELNKKFQRSDWGQRPLSQEQIDYARLDTRFLLPLYRQLSEELKTAGRGEIAESEFRRLEKLPAKKQQFDPDEFIRLKGAKALDPVSLQILKSLFLKRDELARQLGLPHFRVIPNETLVELARIKPKNEKSLTRARGFTWKQVRRFGAEVLQAIEGGQSQGPLLSRPKPAPRDELRSLSEEELFLYDRLRLWRKKKAEEQGLDSSHVLRREWMIELCKKRPGSLEALESIGVLEPWQIKSYGDEILRVLQMPLVD